MNYLAKELQKLAVAEAQAAAEGIATEPYLPLNLSLSEIYLEQL